jgi:hypothetical protein
MPSILKNSKAKAALALANNYVTLGAAHELDTANPHVVTKIQIGLGNADDTSDLDKPVSTATTTAINDAIAATDIQDVYNNSITPEILTDLTRGALTVQEATTDDTASVYEGKNNVGAVTFEVKGNGEVNVKDVTPSDTLGTTATTVVTAINEVHTEVDLKAPIASPTFTGTVTVATILDASNLPTADPLVIGQVWSNLGILTVSSG